MIEMDGYSLDMPGLTRSLGFPCNDDLEGLASIEPVCRALEALRPWIRPLSIDLLLHAYGRDEGPAVELPRPFWFGVEAKAESALGLEPSTGGEPIVRRVDEMTPKALERLMAEALEANPLPEDVVVRWDEVRIFATEVRLPDSLSTRDMLVMGPEDNSFAVPVEHRADGVWVRGPRSMGELPPMSLMFSGPFVSADLATYWSIWTPNGVGGSDVDAAIAGLDAVGWKLRRLSGR
jgi:hypothetical protein